MVDRLSNAADIRGDHRKSCAHRLQGGQREALLPGDERKQVDLREQHGNITADAQQLDPIRQPQRSDLRFDDASIRSIADEPQSERSRDPCERAEEEAVILGR